jgi:2-oxo-4-hydroxy-4-carboxy--5-ureidoimidazoline (OHCU) decarboxylase
MMTWISPAIIGAAVGGIATVLVGFNYAGWVSNRSAERMANQQSIAAVTAALLPVCVIQSRADPEAIAKTQHVGALSSLYERRAFVMKAGWATMPATQSPNSDLAAACAAVLATAAQS